MQIYTCIERIEEIEFKQKFVPLAKYYNGCSTLDISYISTDYAHFVHFYTFESSMNA